MGNTYALNSASEHAFLIHHDICSGAFKQDMRLRASAAYAVTAMLLVAECDPSVCFQLYLIVIKSIWDFFLSNVHFCVSKK